MKLYCVANFQISALKTRLLCQGEAMIGLLGTKKMLMGLIYLTRLKGLEYVYTRRKRVGPLVREWVRWRDGRVVSSAVFKERG